MRKFIIKIIIFICLSLCCLVPLESWYYYSGLFQQKVDGKEVYDAINYANKGYHKYIKKIIIGDSVGKQLIPTGTNNASDVLSLTSNRAITMAGYYFLLENYLIQNSNNIPNAIILFVTPHLLSASFDCFSYQYFLKPFYNNKYEKWYSINLEEECQNIPFYWSSNLPFIRSSNYSPKYTIQINNDNILVSKISQEYFYKIDSLCVTNKIQFHIVPTPTSDFYQTKIDKNFNMSKETIPESLHHYFSNIRFYPDSIFIDHIHIKSEYLEQFHTQIYSVLELNH